jgi:AcrR family transcriptional regulator
MLANANPGGETVSSRQRLSSAERRLAIVNAAVELFSQRGFRGTTTRELAAAVGVSEPVLYQHFATKRELYSAIVDHLMERTQLRGGRLEELSQQDDPGAYFTELGLQVVGWYTEDPANFRVMLFSALEDHELAELWYERIAGQFLSRVERYIAGRIEAGSLNVENAAVAARAFLGMVAQYGMAISLFRTPVAGVAPDEVVRQFVRAFLEGISTPKGRRKR